MPSRSRVQSFVATVEEGSFIEALQAFYAPDAATRENMDEPLRGLERLIEKEKMVLAAHRSVATRAGTQFLLDGDLAVINWIFEFERRDGSKFTLNELAHQRWSGDHIVEEQYYYDPAQRQRAGD